MAVKKGTFPSWQANDETWNNVNLLPHRNFWASEIYFFHSLDQMRLVAEMCPKIAKMLFMFQDRWGNIKIATDWPKQWPNSKSPTGG